MLTQEQLKERFFYDQNTGIFTHKLKSPSMAIGCVKGQAGYWNKIRVDFPEAFDRMAKQERKMGVAINKSYAGDKKRKRVFLDELDPKAGRDVPLPDIECGAICITPEQKFETVSRYEGV